VSCVSINTASPVHLGSEGSFDTALYEGVFETPLWKTFLDQLRCATGADYAILNCRPLGRPAEDALDLLSGDVSPAIIQQVDRRFFHPSDSIETQTLIEARPYALDELFGADGAPRSAFYRGSAFHHELVDVFGITAIRQMRVREASGVDGWLTIARRGEDFTARDEALLSSIAPVLRGVLRLYVEMERKQFAASLTAEAVRRLHFGWLALDRGGTILECDEQGALVLSNSGVLRRGAAGRLVARPVELEREIFAALNRVAESPRARPRAITLSREPWLDMLLVRARHKSISAKTAPTVIAYVHRDSWRSTDRCEQLAELFALSPREARLALALSRGMTIAEAACEFGLTIETARNYSKGIYAKTGARGLPDLVRLVMRSILAISPDA
jgi:DNA-binding CsgD family transcriptional regulator